MKKFIKNHKKEKVGVLIFPISKKIIALSKSVYILNLKILIIFLLGLVIFSLIFYIFQVASLISAKYQIQKYQKKINEILEKNTELEINLAKINSLEEITQKMQELGFEKTKKVYYLQILETPVAKKE